MKKLLLLLAVILMSQFVMSQTVVVLDMPTPCSGIGIEEWSNEVPSVVFDVFPNPSDNYVTLSVITQTSVLGKMTVEVSDLSGRVLLKEDYYSAHDQIRTLLDLSKLESGAYIISMRNAEGVICKKIIKR